MRPTIVILATSALSGCSLILDPTLDDIGGALKFGELCSGDSQCETGMCRTRRCSQSCTTACPSGSSCTAGECVFDRPPPVPNLKVGMLYVGPVGDHGWTATHEESRQYFLQNLSNVESEFAPFIDTANAAAKIDDFIANGDNVIIGTSFDFLNPILNRSANRPDLNFLLCSGFQTSPNLGSYFGRMEQAVYIAGNLAGRMTKTKKLGLVGPVVIPETVRFINAFVRGARAADPAITAYVRWTYAWFDPVNEPIATDELIAKGADVIFSQTDTTISLETTAMRCTERGSACLTTTGTAPLYTIGYDNKDSCERFGGGRCLTSAYWNWGPMITRILRSMQDGTWDPREVVFEQMKSDPDQSPVYYSPINTQLVPSTIRVPVEALIAQMAENTPEGRGRPFLGPVVDNTGTTRVQAGAVITDDEQLSMCWYVDGVYDMNDRPGVVPTQCVGTR